MTRGMRGGPGPDHPTAPIHADVGLVAEHRHRAVYTPDPIRRRPGLGVFHRPACVIRQCLSDHWRSIDEFPPARFRGLFAQSSGTRPSRSARFSSSVFRCFGAATTVASTICPPMAMKLADRRRASKRRKSASIAGTPSSVARVGASRKFQIEFASGTRSASDSPRKRPGRQPILDQKFRPLIRQRMARLEDQDPEHKHVILGRPATLRAIRPRHGALQFGSEHLEIHQRVHPLEIDSLRREIPKSLLDVEKSRLAPHDPSPAE